MTLPRSGALPPPFLLLRRKTPPQEHPQQSLPAPAQSGNGGSLPRVAGDTGDARLSPFLVAAGESAADAALAALFEVHLDPVLRRVVSSFFSTGRSPSQQESAEEALGEPRLSLLRRLREIREGKPSVPPLSTAGASAPSDTSGTSAAASHPAAGAAAVPIGDIGAYAATCARHACESVLRQRDPRRHLMSNRLRYLLKHTDGLAAWQDGRERVAGFAAWKTEPAQEQQKPAHSRLQEQRRQIRLLLLRENAPRLLQEAFPNLDHAALSDARFCAALFDAVGAPVPLRDLVAAFLACRPDAQLPAAPSAAMAAVFTARQDSRTDSSVSNPRTLEERLVDDRPCADLGEQVIQRHHLSCLWEQVRQLPPRQAAALLLNLRDHKGRGAVALLPLLGVAALPEIGQVLRMSREQLEDLWDDLPLDDQAIGAMLEATPQQVINLRKVARERLQRRMSID